MDTSRIEKNGKIFILAYDQGLEHGPSDFNDKNYNPEFILKIALEGGATCMTMQYGMAKQIYTSEIAQKMPLIMKLNGKSKLNKKNLHYAITGSVEEAVNLGAVGIGFTINPGQEDEQIEYTQFCQVRKEAEKAGLITVLWSYARGPEIIDQFDKSVVAYAARVAGELGADVAKIKYSGSADNFAYAVKMAGKTKVVASGTDNFPADYVSGVQEMLKSGAYGLAVGRKIWQDENPIDLSKKLANVIYNS
jgi:fructose-bisphosphate aldolase, class I